MSAAGRLRWRKFVNVVMLGGTGVCAAATAGATNRPTMPAATLN